MADWEKKDGRDQETVRRVEIRGMREAEGWGNRRLDWRTGRRSEVEDQRQSGTSRPARPPPPQTRHAARTRTPPPPAPRTAPPAYLGPACSPRRCRCWAGSRCRWGRKAWRGWGWHRQGRRGLGGRCQAREAKSGRGDGQGGTRGDRAGRGRAGSAGHRPPGNPLHFQPPCPRAPGPLSSSALTPKWMYPTPGSELHFFLCLHVNMLFPGGSVVKTPLAMQETQETPVRSLGWEGPLEKEIATYSNILLWESHGQRSMAGSSLWGCKVGHDWARTHTLITKRSPSNAWWVAGSAANNIPINLVLVVSINRQLSSLPIKLSWDKWQLHDIEVASLDFLGGPVVKNPPAIKGTWVPSLVREDSICHEPLSRCPTTTGPQP